MPDYRRIHDAFIQDRWRRQEYLERYETHHILPRCLGGKDEPENLIRLSPGDHLFVHILLAKIHGGKLVSAAVRMCGMERYRGRHSRERYTYLRSMARENMIGNKYGAGVARTEEFKQGLSKRSKGQTWCRGIKRSEEFKNKQRQRMTGNKLGLGNKSQTGLVFTTERLEKHQKRMIGNDYAKGTKRTPEQIAHNKERRAESVRGKPDPRIGVKQSPEHVAKRVAGMAAAREARLAAGILPKPSPLKGRPQSPEHAAKSRIARKGKV